MYQLSMASIATSLEYLNYWIIETIQKKPHERCPVSAFHKLLFGLKGIVTVPRVHIMTCPCTTLNQQHASSVISTTFILKCNGTYTEDHHSIMLEYL